MDKVIWQLIFKTNCDLIHNLLWEIELKIINKQISCRIKIQSNQETKCLIKQQLFILLITTMIKEIYVHLKKYNNTDKAIIQLLKVRILDIAKVQNKLIMLLNIIKKNLA